ncbi:MAG: hypothetical protein FXF49_04585 [Flexistipes sinusarabici]|uniref:Uncharacterized protein n=1 Tax=Flexistipes sinusarabici TaxID=2352 RepID=A0A3D5Q9X4_FLESI|nr:hypothetical protein [Flexistipes sinusarabici]TYB33779.1 MAG: hypothetical protein FXF49_04585 [Flexistipes sinusarabici]HCW92460.1 hypothetical protein [Flexistipes sinusarabici]
MTGKIVLSVLLAALLFFSVFAITKPEMRKSGLFDRITTEYLDTNMERTAVAFAVSRGVNALVSFLQDADLEMGVGVSAQFSPGEFLDPLNDMVERFSWLMLLCFTVIGVEKILFEIFQSTGFFLLAFSSLFFLVFIWWKKMFKFSKIFVKLAFLGLMLICWIPAQAAIGDFIYNNYLESNYEEAQTFLKQHDSKQEIESSGWFGNMKSILNVKEKIENFRNAAENYYDKIMSLIVIFTLESIILPLVTLYAGLKILSYTFGRNTKINDFANHITQKFSNN